jgi:hypothetical protein
MIKKAGLVAAGVGLLGALIGWLWHLLVPTPDANIGAGLLVVLGLPAAGVGGVLLLVSLLRGRAR